jgi:hypothetical protein
LRRSGERELGDERILGLFIDKIIRNSSKLAPNQTNTYSEPEFEANEIWLLANYQGSDLYLTHLLHSLFIENALSEGDFNYSSESIAF